MKYIKNMKPVLLSGWTLMRALRVIGGAWLLIYGIVEHDWLFGIAGGYFFMQGLLNVRCVACRNNACEVENQGELSQRQNIVRNSDHFTHTGNVSTN